MVKSVSARRAARTAKAEAKRVARAQAKAAKVAITKEAMAAINRLDAIGKEITAKLVLHDRASVKADDMLISINELLKEAEKLCADNAACGSMMSFATFKEKVCPSLGRSATYEVRAILLGKKTKEELALSNRSRQAKHQAKVRAERTAREAEKVASPLYNGRLDPNIGMPPGPKLALLPDNRIVPVTGNAPKPEPWSTDEAPPVGKQKPNMRTPEEKSGDLLTLAKTFWREEIVANGILDDDVKKFRVFLSDEKQWRPRTRTTA